MLLRLATETEIDMIQVCLTGDHRKVITGKTAIFFEKTPEDRFLSAFNEATAIKLLEHFNCSLSHGVVSYVEKDVISEYSMPKYFDQDYADFQELRVPSKFQPTARVAPVAQIAVVATVLIKTDNVSIPNSAQLEVLESLPLTLKLWENVHGKTRSVLLARGWVIMQDRLAILTDGGKESILRSEAHALLPKLKRGQRRHTEEKIVKPEAALVSPKRHEALIALAADRDAINIYHHIVKHYLVKSGMINADGSFRSVGAAMLQKLGITMTNNSVVDDFVAPPKAEKVKIEKVGPPKRRGRLPNPNKKPKPLVSAGQHEGLLALSNGSEAIDTLHHFTKKSLLVSNWINEDGTFTPSGAELLEKLGIKISNNIIAEMAAPKTDVDELDTNTVTAKQFTKSLSLMLTAKQIEVFENIALWSNFHSKTKNHMINKGWVSANGNLTSLGERIRKAL